VRAGRTPRILVVEHHRDLRRVLRYSLMRTGYAVDEAATGPDALDVARRQRPDLVLLDVLLPGLDGLEVCRILRREMASVAVVMITVKAAEADRQAGLDAGADDYVTKPFSMEDLRARIAALLARAGLSVEPTPITVGGRVAAQAEARSADRRGAAPGRRRAPRRVGGLVLDPATRTVELRGEAVPLAPKEFELLALLLAHQGRALTRDQIARAIWSGDVQSNTISVHVRWLREKLERYEPLPFRISTVFSVGYRLDRVGDVG